MDPLLAQLAALVDCAVPPGESHLRQGPLWAVRFDRPIKPSLAVYGPMLCVVAQGAKELLVGDERLVYDAGRFLLNTVAVPASGGVVEELARECGLSPSAFHRAFKRVTAMTPVQYQRRMRLQEAKRLTVGEGLDAAGAGARVGYDDPSYFSREYRRFFGDPPRRHVERLREEAGMDGWAVGSV